VPDGTDRHYRIRSDGRLPRRRLHVQGRPDRLVPASSVLRRPGTSDRTDRGSRRRRGRRLAHPRSRRSRTVMTIHPARAVAGLGLGAAGFVVGVAALAVVLAKLLVNAGMPAQRADVATLNDVVAVLPFVIGF